MVSREASCSGCPWPLPSWGVCVHVCVCLCVVFLCLWPDVRGVFTHVSWHVHTCLHCVIVCDSARKGWHSGQMEEISSSSPPILYMSLCPLSPHLFYSCPRLLYLSVFPLSVSIPALPLQRYKASQRQGVQLPASAAERQRGIVKGVGVCSTKWNKQKLLHMRHKV